MNDRSNQFAAFKDWYDAQWLGDREHGQFVPVHTGDARYTEYLDGYTLALGAWISATAVEREACAKVCDAVGMDYHDAVSVECGRRIRAR